VVVVVVVVASVKGFGSYKGGERGAGGEEKRRDIGDTDGRVVGRTARQHDSTTCWVEG
jgi:hypothetical protein